MVSQIAPMHTRAPMAPTTVATPAQVGDEKRPSRDYVLKVHRSYQFARSAAPSIWICEYYYVQVFNKSGLFEQCSMWCGSLRAGSSCKALLISQPKMYDGHDAMACTLLTCECGCDGVARYTYSHLSHPGPSLSSPGSGARWAPKRPWQTQPQSS
jgi:hypothetical protein